MGGAGRMVARGAVKLAAAMAGFAAHPLFTFNKLLQIVVRVSRVVMRTVDVHGVARRALRRAQRQRSAPVFSARLRPWRAQERGMEAMRELIMQGSYSGYTAALLAGSLGAHRRARASGSDGSEALLVHCRPTTHKRVFHP